MSELTDKEINLFNKFGSKNYAKKILYYHQKKDVNKDIVYHFYLYESINNDIHYNIFLTNRKGDLIPNYGIESDVVIPMP